MDAKTKRHCKQSLLCLTHLEISIIICYTIYGIKLRKVKKSFSLQLSRECLLLTLEDMNVKFILSWSTKSMFTLHCSPQRMSLNHFTGFLFPFSKCMPTFHDLDFKKNTLRRYTFGYQQALSYKKWGLHHSSPSECWLGMKVFFKCSATSVQISFSITTFLP